MELREKVAQLVRSAAFPASDAVGELCDASAEMVADRILALPEIAEALRDLRLFRDLAEELTRLTPSPLVIASITELTPPSSNRDQ